MFEFIYENVAVIGILQNHLQLENSLNSDYSSYLFETAIRLEAITLRLERTSAKFGDF